MKIFLTIRNTFKDAGGTWRYAGVSWPIWSIVDGHYRVKDIDGTYFECALLNAIQSDRPSRLINVSMEEYKYLSRGYHTSDYNKLYKDVLGIDQSLNTRAKHEYGRFDENKKKEIINNEGDTSTSERVSILKRNLFIED